nr:unnamed protein product [Callosobruchus analis]
MASTDGDSSQSLIAELVKALQSQRSAEQVDLPYFRPETNESTKWAGQVETIKHEVGWSDVQTLARIGQFLLNGAKTWFERWNPDNRDWDSFCIDFTEAFPPKRNLGRLLKEAAKFTSSFMNTYESYVHEKSARLKNLRAHWSESDLVELIVYGVSELEVRNAAINANCKTISELSSELNSYHRASGSGKTNIMVSLITHPNGLRFSNVYMHCKSPYKPNYQYLRKVLEPLKEIGYFEYTDDKNIVPPNLIKPNSLIIFDDVASCSQDIIDNTIALTGIEIPIVFTKLNWTMASTDGDSSQSLIAELVKALQSQRSAEQVDLPYFRPETNESTKWAGQVETIKHEVGWSDVQTLARIGQFLLNGAKTWFERWNPDNRDWDSFCIDFTEAFPPKRNLGRLLKEAAKFTSSFMNTYESYVHEKSARLKNLRAHWSESDLVELIVYGVSELEVRNAAINANCKTISELSSELNSYHRASGSGKTNIMVSLITHPNGLRFSNVYMHCKSPYKPNYQYLRKVLEPLKEIGYFEYTDDKNIVPPNLIKPNSLIIFDDVASCSQDIIDNTIALTGIEIPIVFTYLCQTYTAIPKHLLHGNATKIIAAWI